MKRYAILPILLCIFFSACSEMPIDYLNSRPHKSIRQMYWLPEGQSFVAAIHIPVSSSKYEYRFYTYNTNGEKIAETPPLKLRYDYLSGFYLSADGKYAVVDNSPVEIVEIATGKVVAVYDSVKLLSQAHGTDEYVVRDYSQYFPTGPYYEYKVATITPSGIEYHSSVRLLQENAYSVIFTPIFTPKKKIVTCEYDSMNALELVVRDSTLNKLHSTSLSLTNSYEIRSIAIGVNKIIYSGYYEGGFILDLINGTLDSSHILPPTDNSGKIEISSDGNKLFLPNNSNDILVSYDIPSKTTYTLTSYPTRMYLSSLALSLDDKRIAYVLTDSNNEDQLVVLQLP